MLRLKNFKWNNIGRFTTEQFVNFEDHSQLIEIDGKNLNTQGSSGAAKSTFLNAIEYNLGVNEVSATVLQSRLTKNGMMTEGVYDWNGQEITIHRSKNEGLVVKLPNETLSGSNAIAEEKLLQIINLPKDLIRKIFHKRQGEQGFFLSLTPSESYKFLTNTLGLNDWSKKQEKAQLEHKLKTELLAKKQNELNMAKVSLEAQERILANLICPEQPSLDQDRLLIVKKEIEETKANLLHLEESQRLELHQMVVPAQPQLPRADTSDFLSKLSTINQKIKDVDAEIVAIHQNAHSQQSSLLKQKSDILIKLNEIKMAKNNLPKLEAELEEVKKGIIAAKNSTCPTCAQLWQNETNASFLSRKIEEAKSLVGQINRLKEIAEKESDLNTQITQVETQIQEQKTQIDTKLQMQMKESLNSEKQAVEIEKKGFEDSHNQKIAVLQKAYSEELKAYNDKLSEVRNRYSTVINDMKIEISKKEAEINHAKDTVAVYQRAKTLYDNSKSQSEINVITAQKAVAATMAELSGIEEDSKISEAAAEILKSYINNLFQSALDQISHETNKLLSQIPNCATTTISFDSVKETKTGAIKEAVNCMVSTDNEVGIPLKSLSGGERRSVELAVDLSVVKFVESVSNAGFDFFCLDEAFNGLDSQSIDAVLNILESYGDKRFLLVDHNPEIKSRIKDKITIQRDGQHSQVL